MSVIPLNMNVNTEFKFCRFISQVTLSTYSIFLSWVVIYHIPVDGVDGQLTKVLIKAISIISTMKTLLGHRDLLSLRNSPQRSNELLPVY